MFAMLGSALVGLVFGPLLLALWLLGLDGAFGGVLLLALWMMPRPRRAQGPQSASSSGW
jgi:hypothetical protein